jgi:hypothetical protein
MSLCSPVRVRFPVPGRYGAGTPYVWLDPFVGLRLGGLYSSLMGVLLGWDSLAYGRYG